MVRYLARMVAVGIIMFFTFLVMVALDFVGDEFGDFYFWVTILAIGWGLVALGERFDRKTK